MFWFVAFVANLGAVWLVTVPFTSPGSVMQEQSIFLLAIAVSVISTMLAYIVNKAR